MKDAKGQLLTVGDYILVAFPACGRAYLEYATVTDIKDLYSIKVRFDTSISGSGCKTRTLNYKSSILKVDREFA